VDVAPSYQTVLLILRRGQLKRDLRSVATDQIDLSSVADSGITAIDRVFDLVDSVVDKADRVFNRAKYTDEQHRARRAKIIDTVPAVKAVKKEASPPSSSTAIVKRRFRIVEAIAAETGCAIFVVTDGGSARAECTTRELAEKILGMLETAP
jgi:hypothetical protein